MTIKDIAKLSGFGVGTVSRALNGHPEVSAETRHKIHEIVEQVGFVPNSNARSLKQTASEDVLIIFHGNANIFLSMICEQIQPELAQRGIKAQLHYVDERATEIGEARRLIAEQKPQGVIFLGGNVTHFEADFASITIPTVLCTVDARSMGYPNMSSVCVDDRLAGMQAIEYLYGMGHRNIGLITGSDEGNYPAHNRLLGSIETLRSHGLTYDESYCEPARFSLEEGYAAAQALLARHPDITALFVMADQVAIGAMRAIQDMGLSVPEDVSVVGFDGIPMTRYTNPRLTTMRQPIAELAAVTAKLLMRQLRPIPTVSHTLLPVTLWEGGSVRRMDEHK